LKLGARVLVSVRRVVVHLPASFPFLPIFQQVALALDAAGDSTASLDPAFSVKDLAGSSPGVSE